MAASTSRVLGKHPFVSLALVVLVVAAVGAGLKINLGSHASGFDVKSYLSQFVAGTPNEGVMHGVPSNYDWSSQAVEHAGVNPPAGTGYTNYWGQMYVDSTDIRPANTRVDVANCGYWVLRNGASTWEEIQSSPFDGGPFKEDFTSSAGSLNVRAEPDGSQSLINTEGYNAHIWPASGLANVGSTLRAAITTCATKLILANAAATDDRANAHYLLGVGADWRAGNYACPNNVCTPLGLGKNIYVKTTWRRAVYTTMTSSDLGSIPLPPATIFQNPDGSYGDAQTVTATPTATPLPSPSVTVSPTSLPSFTPSSSPKSLPADMDSNGSVNIFDLSYLLSHWGTADIKADINHSGKVDIFDLSALLSEWTG